MASVMPTPKQQFFDAAGNPLSGGLLYTYMAGTTTPKATWSDYGATVPNTNPIVLDARGEAMKSMARLNNVAYIDTNQRFGGFVLADAMGFYASDGIHLSASGYADEAKNLFNILNII